MTEKERKETLSKMTEEERGAFTKLQEDLDKVFGPRKTDSDWRPLYFSIVMMALLFLLMCYFEFTGNE